MILDKGCGKSAPFDGSLLSDQISNNIKPPSRAQSLKFETHQNQKKTLSHHQLPAVQQLFHKVHCQKIVSPPYSSSFHLADGFLKNVPDVKAACL